MNDFEKLVLEMRNAQKEYFKHRGTIALQTSKKLEREVDQHLSNITNPKMNFDG